MSVSRRALLGAAAGAAAVTAAGARLEAAEAPPPATGLSPIASGVAPISPEEHLARLAKLQGLMQRRRIAAFLVEAGSTLEYFTGVRWWRSERTTAALVPAEVAWWW